MNRKTLLFSAAVMLMGWSCEKPDNGLQPGGETVSINASLPGGHSWNDGDQITVNSRKYTIAEGIGTSNAVFNGVTKAASYGAAYNYGIGKVENNVLSITVPDTQRDEDAHINPMVASSSTTDLAFIPLTGTLEIPIKGSATITRIEISSTKGDKLSGKATVALTFKDSPAVQFAETASPIITLEPGATSLPATFSVNMIAASYQDLKLMIYDNAGNIMAHTVPATSIKGNEISRTNEIEFKIDGPQPKMITISSESDAFGNASTWTSDSQVNINGTSALIKKGAGTANGEFGPVEAAENYYVLAPASASKNFAGKIFTVNLPSKIAFGTDLSQYNIRAGKAEGSTSVSLQYLTGVVKIKVAGTRNLLSAELKNNNGDPISGEAIVSLNGSEPSLLQRGSGSESITMQSFSGYSINGGKELYFAVPENIYDEGFTLTLTDDKNLTYVHKIETATVSRNQVADLGSLTWEGSDADNSNLSAIDYANCYMVATKGTYYFETRLYDGTPINNITKADWLWATKVNGSDQQSLISDIKYENGKISFTASENEGNVLIAAFDASGEIVWSWHIWLTDIPAIVNYHNFDKTGDGFYFQDRNLGAISGEINGDPKETYGLFYQFGRKDPFFGGHSETKETKETAFKNAKEQTICNTKYKQAGWKSAEGKKEEGTVAFATANPMFFLAGNETSGQLSWLATDQFNQFQGPSDGLWKPFEKTNYDPCPPGYQIPRRGAWNGLIYQQTCVWEGKGTELQGMIFTNDEGIQTWYPAQGYREAHPQTMGALVNEGIGDTSIGDEYGAISIWLSEVLTGAYYHTATVLWPMINGNDDAGCANGYNVRCVKEYKYKDIVIPN